MQYKDQILVVVPWQGSLEALQPLVLSFYFLYGLLQSSYLASLGKKKWCIVKVVIIGILLTKHTSVADMWEQVTTTDVIMSHLKDVKLSTQLKGHF